MSTIINNIVASDFKLDYVRGTCSDLVNYVEKTGVKDIDGKSHETFWGVTSPRLHYEFEFVFVKGKKPNQVCAQSKKGQVDYKYVIETPMARIEWRPTGRRSPECEKEWRRVVAHIERHERQHADESRAIVQKANEDRPPSPPFKGCGSSKKKAKQNLEKKIKAYYDEQSLELLDRIKEKAAELDATDKISIECSECVNTSTNFSFSVRMYGEGSGISNEYEKLDEKISGTFELSKEHSSPTYSSWTGTGSHNYSLLNEYRSESERRTSKGIPRDYTPLDIELDFHRADLGIEYNQADNTHEYSVLLPPLPVEITITEENFWTGETSVRVVEDYWPRIWEYGNIKLRTFPTNDTGRFGSTIRIVTGHESGTIPDSEHGSFPEVHYEKEWTLSIDDHSDPDPGPVV